VKLEIELIPRSSFFTNVRSLVSQTQWDIIRKKCYQQAGYRCEICNGKGPKWPVECHEVWHYNPKTLVQKLVRLIALCPACHEVKHFGLARVKGRDHIAKAHLMEINKIGSEEADRHIGKAFNIWKTRNMEEWELDVSFLKHFLREK
jgi:hypothetical protein